MVGEAAGDTETWKFRNGAIVQSFGDNYVADDSGVFWSPVERK